MLFVERSNRTENLLAGLTRRLMAPGNDPLAPGVVVVQGAGMERWVAQSIARERGVCANLRFLFPRHFLDRVFRCLPDSPYGAPNPHWEVGPLGWRVARQLDRHRNDPDFEPLVRHLEAADGDWRLVQLAHRIAFQLDQYITFRPEWTRRWSEDPVLPTERDERWQARLYRELHGEIGPGHLADRTRHLLECLAGSDRSALEERLRSEFPDAIEIFAVSTLPPLYLAVIDGLAAMRDIRLSVLAPSRRYFGDLWRELKEAGADEPTSGESAEARSEARPGLFDAGASDPIAVLLAGLGRLGGEFQANLEEFAEHRAADSELFEVPGAAGRADAPAGKESLLVRLQKRLLDLDAEESDASPADRNARALARDDDSIRIHLCPGPRRELEVLEAILRDAFERDGTLTPEDVIVMVPSIDDLAPDIDAVFGVADDDSGRIPYRIADRGALRRSPAADAFRSLLDLLGGRGERAEVLDWLAREPVRERFGLDDPGVERLAEWAERAGIRFGFDEQHREALGLARDRAHTLRGGLDRLALAHAVGEDDEVFAGLIPVPLDAFADRELLGAAGEVESVLSEARLAAQTPRSVAEWCDWLMSLIERTIARQDANAHEHAAIRAVLVELSKGAAAAGFERPIPFEAMRERVGEALEATPSPQAFLAGGVTFCELVPLRAIPFRVVAILGLSDAAFPRGRPAAGYDLMARSPRPGDRTSRIDDRYLFLEALLSARDRLILTVPARDLRDGSRLPASVVVSELLDAIEGRFALEADAEPTGTGSASSDLREWLVVPHALQGFSLRYFEAGGDRRLCGRSPSDYAAASKRREALAAGGGEPRRFLGALGSSGGAAPSERPASGDDDRRVLSLDELAERILRSTRFFARERLRLRLPRPEAAIGDLDPIDLDPLETASFGAAHLEAVLAGAPIADATRRLLAQANLPTGVVGRLSARAIEREVEEIVRIGRARRSGERLDDRPFELVLSGSAEGCESRIVGRLDDLWPGGRIRIAFARVGRQAELDLWIRHLVLCALVEQGLGLTPRSVLVGRTADARSSDHVVVFERVPEARSLLTRLFEWARGADEAPLPFFPRSSRAFAERAREGNLDGARREAHKIFEGSDGFDAGMPSEREAELAAELLWEGMSPIDGGGIGPLDLHFDVLAEAFFEPLLAARKEARE